LELLVLFYQHKEPLHDLLHLSAPHNIIHLVTGIVFIAVSGHAVLGKWVVIIIGIVHTLVTILGLFMDNIFDFIMVTPFMKAIHFLVAILALVVGFIGQKATSNQNTSV
jgi:hypothetical protein